MPTKASRTSRGAGRSAAVARHARDFLRRSRGENIAEAAVREVREEAGFNPSVADIGMPLWHRCTLTRSWNDPRKHILRKLTTQPDLVPELRGKGLGGKLVATLESLLTARGCPKLSLQLRAGVKRTSMIRAGDDFMFGVAEPYEMYERLCIITGCRQTRVHLTFSFH